MDDKSPPGGTAVLTPPTKLTPLEQVAKSVAKLQDLLPATMSITNEMEVMGRFLNKELSPRTQEVINTLISLVTEGKKRMAGQEDKLPTDLTSELEELQDLSNELKDFLLVYPKIIEKAKRISESMSEHLAIIDQVGTKPPTKKKVTEEAA